jgi:hypothetical protein
MVSIIRSAAFLSQEGVRRGGLGCQSHGRDVAQGRALTIGGSPNPSHLV